MSNTNYGIDNKSQKTSADTLILKPPQTNEIKFFDESPLPIISSTGCTNSSQENSFSEASENSPRKILKRGMRNKLILSNKKVHFLESLIKDYSEPPKLGWIPGSYSTSDLLEAYLKSCDRHKCKPIQKLMQQLKALQDLDCSNGEKVNYLNLKAERIDSKQIETLEEIFKRLSFKTIDLENTALEDESCSATLFEILSYYDTVEKLILANTKTSINLIGWQEISKFIRKGSCLEYLDVRGHIFNELIYFTYLARSIKLTTTLRVIHLEQSNINGRYLLMLAAALKDNEQIKELYLGDNKIQSTDGNSISTIIKENNCLEILDLRNNNMQDIGLSYICSGLSEQASLHRGLKSLIMINNNITANGISYLSKALIHNRSLTTLSISQNSITNEAIFELKEALIVNNQISSLFLAKTKLSDEGVVAIAEYIAETTSLNRLDLRDNDIRVGGLMALFSSLKINNSLSRLDVDREPRKEHFFHIPFQLKDSSETAKKLLQDIMDKCLNNQKQIAVREAERISREIQLAKQLDKERLKTLEENDTDLSNLLNELKSDDSKTTNEEVTGNEMDNDVPKSLNDEEDCIDSDSLNERFFGIDQYNNTHGELTESFQVIEGVTEESTETEPDMVILETSIQTKDHECLNEQPESQVRGINDQQQLELDVLSTANSLIEKVIINLKKSEVDSVQIFHQNSSNLMFETRSPTFYASLNRTSENQDILVDSLNSNDNSKLFSFNDSNDLSVSIEPENSQQNIEDIKPTRPIFSLSDKNCQNEPTSTNEIENSILLDEDEPCNDSDIEVLTVSTKFITNLISKSVMIIEDKVPTPLSIVNQQGTQTSPDSIVEKEVETLINPDTLINPLFIKDSIDHFSSTHSTGNNTPIKYPSQKNESSNFILSSSPFNQFSLSPSKINEASIIQTKDADEIKKESTNVSLSNNFKEKSDSEPFFASKLESSQITEELSNEISFE